jgi:hypothetical protein
LACAQPNRLSASRATRPRPGQLALHAEEAMSSLGRSSRSAPPASAPAARWSAPRASTTTQGGSAPPDQHPARWPPTDRVAAGVRCRTTSTSASGRPSPAGARTAMRRAPRRESTWTDIPKVGDSSGTDASSRVDTARHGQAVPATPPPAARCGSRAGPASRAVVHPGRERDANDRTLG